MFSDEEMLKNFGGVTANSLNSFTNSENVNDTIESYLVNSPESSYFDIDKLFSLFNKNKKSFSILSVNIQSLNAKINQLKVILTNLNQHGCYFSAICLQETWLQDDVDLCLLQIDGYELISQGKICSTHGGLLIYLRQEYDYKILPLNKDSEIWEGQFIEIHWNNLKKKIVLGNIYRPPRDLNENYNNFMKELEPILETLNNKHGELILAGDFNINLLKINDKKTHSDFFDLITSHQLIPRITLPTRFSEYTATLIDNYFCKVTEKCAKAPTGILVTQLSDHFPYFIFLNNDTTKESPPKHIQVSTNDLNSIARFKQSLDNENVLNTLNKNPLADPNENYNILNNLIMKLKATHLPNKMIKFNRHKHKHSKWITQGIIRSITFRDKKYAMLKNTSVNSADYLTLKTNLKVYNKILKQSISDSKKSYYCQLFQKYKHDIKKTWATIKQVLNKDRGSKTFPGLFYLKGEKIKTEQNAADTFNKYFTNIGPNLASEIKTPGNVSYTKYLKNETKHIFHFEPVTETTVTKIIKNLKPKTSCGYDGLSTKLLKEIAPQLIKTLTLIINQCMNTGIFPDSMKIAKVIPLHKKDNLDNIENYRPISLLPAMSKVLEKVIFIQVNHYFTSKGIF